MGNECNIVRDILPLYAENMVSSDTASFVEGHLENCGACRSEYEHMREPQSIPARAEAAPLLKLRKKMLAKEIQTIALAAVFVIVILVSLLAVLDTPQYFPYSEELLRVETMDDGGIEITFDDSVTNFHYTRIVGLKNQERDYYWVEAWSSPFARWFSGRWFSSRGELSFKIDPEEELPISVIYLPNNGEESVCVYGEACDFDGMVPLPRLALGYYLILAAIVFVILLVMWLLAKKKARLRAWLERVMMYPAAYMVSHLVIAGFSFESYSMTRDFLLIVPISILLYCGMLLAHGVWKLRKEIREINRYRES